MNDNDNNNLFNTTFSKKIKRGYIYKNYNNHFYLERLFK